MCGIAGIIGGREKGDALVATIERMKTALRHRGPDGDGTYIDTKAPQPVALGHRRLAIIDPEGGAQPMHLPAAGLSVVFNGAIYNHLELRQELVGKGHAFHSHSDTEVILHAYREWGVSCLEHFNGMFAFALWDAKRARLFCARDHVGIKPFYYRFDGKRFLFGSEIKAIMAVDREAAQADGEGLADYLTFQFTTGDKTMFSGIKRLEPAHFLLADVTAKGITCHTEAYWRVNYAADTGLSPEDAVEKLRFLIEDAVRLQLRADVPVGAYLSGGLDSSAVAGIASSMLSGPLKTFTGAFIEGKEFDETPFAHIVAQHARAEQYDTYISGEQFATTLPDLIYYMDEPAAGPGLFPQYFVSKLAAKHVKVCLGGQGGDELFIGYARYLVAYLEHCLRRAIHNDEPAKDDITLADISGSLPMLRGYRPMLQQQWKNGLFESDDQRYFALVDRRDGMQDIFRPDALPANYSPFASFQRIFDEAGSTQLINRMLHFDLKTSLPALLQVEDRASMAASLESRVPLLDYRIVEFMASVPANVKFAHSEMKKLFRQAVHRHVPQTILDRKDKKGFPVPLKIWTKGVAREFVADTLLSKRAKERGLYNMAGVEQAIGGQHQFGRVIWGLLCLELWHREYVDGDYRARLAA